MLVRVTKENILAGRRMSKVACPIAHALIDLGWEAPICSQGFIYDQHFRKETIQRTPEDAAFFMRNFDRGLPVEPFSFELVDDSIDERRAA